MDTVVLTSHPSVPASGIHEVAVRVTPVSRGALELSFVVKGDIDRLRVPEARPPLRADDLWRHTCFEAFVMMGGGPAYRELNFSPSGEWAAYAFRRYRDGEPLAVELEPAVVLRLDRNRLQVDATVPLPCAPQAGSAMTLRLGVAAVLEAADGSLSYWALRHPGDQPDFHHPAGFTHVLPATLNGTSCDGTPCVPYAATKVR